MPAWIKQTGCVLLGATLLTACSQEAGLDKTASNGTSNPASEAASNAAASNAASTASDASARTTGYADEMDKTKIMTFSIDVDEAKWQDMLDHAADEEYIPADVTINGTVIRNVGIRPKGNSSLREVVNDETSDRYSFKIKFDEYVEGQTWEGLDKIVLNNMQADNSYLKEYLSYDIMSEIGVDAPLFSFADIEVNGQAWGFYLAVEVIDSGYLDRTKEGEGELYKPNNDGGNAGGMGAGGFGGGANGGNRGAGGMNGARNGVSLQYTDDNPDSYSAIFDNAETKTSEEDEQRVVTALEHLNEGTELEAYVDVDEVLRYFAAHAVVVNMDSYTSNMGHNYYLYENDGRIGILPWDYNLAFGGFQSGSASEVVNLAIDTPVSGVALEERPLLAKLLEVPAYKEKYHDYLQEIIDDCFANGKFEQTVAGLDELISTHVQNDPSAFCTYEEYRTAVAELIKLGTLRAESVQAQLDGDIPSTTDGQEADSGKLIDASSVDLAKLGKAGGGDGPPGGRRPGSQAAAGAGGARPGESAR